MPRETTMGMMIATTAPITRIIIRTPSPILIRSRGQFATVLSKPRRMTSVEVALIFKPSKSIPAVIADARDLVPPGHLEEPAPKPRADSVCERLPLGGVRRIEIV